MSNTKRCVRWSVPDDVLHRLQEVARFKGVRVNQVVAYLINKEYQAHFEWDEEVVAPWDIPVEVKTRERREYGGNILRYVGNPAREKSSLAWAVANDETFLSELNTGYYGFVSTKWLASKVQQLKEERPDEFIYPFTTVTVRQLTAILIDRGNLTWSKRGVYAVTPGWEANDGTVQS